MSNANLGKKFRHYVDTETGGLNPTKHDLLSVAIVTEEVDLENPYKPGICRTWVRKIQPVNPSASEAKALEVNGYTPEGWADAVPFETVAEEIQHRLSNGVIVGHNVNFDLDFLSESLKRVGIKPTFSHHKIDTVTLAYEHWGLEGDVASISLDPLRRYLGIPVAEVHDPLKDAMDCRTVFYRAISPKPVKSLKRYFQRLANHWKEFLTLWDIE